MTIIKHIANPICKHIAKAPRANAQTKALSMSLQSLPDLPTGHWDCQRSKNKINLCFVVRSVRLEIVIKTITNRLIYS
jgi:hypothetical protein